MPKSTMFVPVGSARIKPRAKVKRASDQNAAATMSSESQNQTVDGENFTQVLPVRFLLGKIL